METPRTPRHRHRAKAGLDIRCSEEVRARIESSPILEESRASGLIAARRATELLPRTPAAELTQVDIDYEWDGDTLRVTAFVQGFSRGHLGSRALLSVNVCATNIADMLPRQLSVTLEDSAIEMERGGLEDLEYAFDPPVRAAVLVVSDAVVSGVKDDRAGETVRRAVDGLEGHGVRLVADEILGDHSEEILETILQWRADEIDLILTVGGTGLTHTDVTVEVVEPILDREIPGLMEAIRDYGQEQTPVAFMSRGIAGLTNDTLVVTLPGSSSGAKEATEAVFPALLHVFETLRKSNKHLQD